MSAKVLLDALDMGNGDVDPTERGECLALAQVTGEASWTLEARRSTRA